MLGIVYDEVYYYNMFWATYLIFRSYFKILVRRVECGRKVEG